jgi:diaminohydroxyphosphoribosylaminopyrimidine deaminase / 5-amino-6-(5-phosphoribosylamino)uracil reductase
MLVDPTEHNRFMATALSLGRRGLGRAWPNPAVGAVLVRPSAAGPVVVGRGWTQPGGRPHAEAEALARAGEHARGATLYVTLEPCSHAGRGPPCADAVIASGVAHVVSALEDPNPRVAGDGHARLRASGVTVEVGVGAAEARRAHAGHIRRVRDRRPNVMLKLAVSADGKAGLAGRRPAAITGEPARDRVHLMRAMSDAILVGIGTVLADDPLLTCRLPGLSGRSPVRIVLDSTLRLPLDGRLVRSAREVPVWVVAAAVAADRAQALEDRGVTVLRGEVGEPGRLDLAAALRLIAGRGITRLMVEGGPTIAAALIALDLVDEAALLRSDRLIGAGGIEALAGMPLAALASSPRLKSVGIEPVGADRLELFARI